ncbi:hypothetical protein PR202_gb16700 [Eleusine coracana subsp. coracana]|uniref:Uncharacterized protein n=1 Tax=Eleusine coracana subsp. coracana TaxID=191504 RepID=A0AAV5F2K4_ELECO|nr:hypothetical protein PR202_gb16700 [Eleusine coracana subsp. coracana]
MSSSAATKEELKPAAEEELEHSGRIAGSCVDDAGPPVDGVLVVNEGRGEKKRKRPVARSHESVPHLRVAKEGEAKMGVAFKSSVGDYFFRF